MKFRITLFIALNLLLVSIWSCVDKAKPSTYQTIHLYTDFSESFNSTFFRDFGRKNHIDVHVHYSTSDKIYRWIKEKKYKSGADLVILKNALDLIHINSIKGLQAPKGEVDFYQALWHDPYVFEFPYDTIPLFSSYGQVFRSKHIKINPDSIRDPKEWRNLIGGLVQKYPNVPPDSIYKTIMRTDSLKGKNLKQLSILRHSSLKSTKGIVYPDQYYKGSVGKIAGIALIRQSKNRTNALLLYDYCKKEWWRKKLATKLNLFPILSEEHNKNGGKLIYQGLIKK